MRPVPLLMIMAPNSGDHPCARRCLTKGLRRVEKPQEMAESTTMTMTMKGSEVLTKTIKIAETNASSDSVTRSPRQLATGGAILSGIKCQDGKYIAGYSHTRIKPNSSAE